jgi:hypothetical protein
MFRLLLEWKWKEEQWKINVTHVATRKRLTTPPLPPHTMTNAAPKEKESMEWVRETCPSVSDYNYLDNDIDWGGGEGNDGGGMVAQQQDADSRLPQSEAWQKMAATLAICRQQQHYIVCSGS